MAKSRARPEGAGVGTRGGGYQRVNQNQYFLAPYPTLCKQVNLLVQCVAQNAILLGKPQKPVFFLVARPLRGGEGVKKDRFLKL